MSRYYRHNPEEPIKYDWLEDRSQDAPESAEDRAGEVFVPSEPEDTEPEPRDCDTPIRMDQDRRDVEEYRERGVE